MIKLLCVYFILHLQLVRSDSICQQRNCSTALKPLLNIIIVQGRIAQSIVKEEQIPVEHVTPSLEVIPCDLIHFREDIEEDHNQFETEIDKHLKNSKLTIDPGCGCSYIQPHEWKPDEWTNFTENKLQQQTQGYKMVMLNWARVPQEKFIFSHINPKYHYKRHIYGYYSHDLLAFVEYTV